MKIKSLFLFFLLCFSVVQAQDKAVWKRIDPFSVQLTSKLLGKVEVSNAVLFQLDEQILKSSLKSVQDKKDSKDKIIITIPNINGNLEQFSIHEDSNFDPELQAKYPEIRSYSGVGITDATAVLNFSISPLGIQTMICRNGNQMEFIEKDKENGGLYVVFDSGKKSKDRLPFSCTTVDSSVGTKKLSPTAKIVSSDKKFRTLRLALSCTGEYAAYFGGTVNAALAAINATLTRINGIYNRDLAVKLLLIANNDQIIYTNASTDPYSNATNGVGTSTMEGTWGTELQNNLNSVIGSSNYDIGHLFGASGGGGNAGCIGCICNSGKGSAYTSPANNVPAGDNFDIDFVAHEMGHQLGANHTFTFDIEGTIANVEPGSGSTIMGYAGITTDYDVEIHSDDYFSFISIAQIQNNLVTKTCPVTTVINTATPIINAGADFTIPKGTAFVLKGTGDPLSSVTYSWEENDVATTANDDLSFAVSSKTNGPLFRSLPPVSTPVRYMPNLENVLGGRLTNKWESVSSVGRTLHFVLTARDNAAQGLAQTFSDEMAVIVNATTGPFEVTSQNIDNLSWFKGAKQEITWNVNNTNILSGAATVNIKLSTDNGLTFPITLAAAVANDGSEIITVPNVSSQFCRIMIEPTNNIFYAVNSTTFAINYLISSDCQTYDFVTPFDIPEQGNFDTSRTFTVPATDASIANVSVDLDVSHAYFSDVQMELVSPQGTVVKLFYNVCGSSSGRLNLHFDDAGSELSCGDSALQNVVPLGVLAKLNGENPQGTWTLRMRDMFTSDLGVLHSASVSICTRDYTLVPDEFNKEVRVSSNPNDGNFNVQYISASGNPYIELYVFDLSGNRIFEEKYTNNGGFNENVQLPNKPRSGVYFILLKDGSTEKTTKMIVK